MMLEISAFFSYIAGNSLIGQLDLDLWNLDHLQILNADQNQLTGLSATLVETGRNLSLLSVRFNQLSKIPDMSSGQGMQLGNLDVSYNYRLSQLDPPAFRLLRGGTVTALYMFKIPCDGHLCWYVLYKWPFSLNVQIKCDGSWIYIDSLTGSDLHCAGESLITVLIIMQSN